MSKMILKRGKFYKDDALIPLEFGNKEQIALLQKAEDFKEGFWTLMPYFYCLCGYQISLSDFKKGKCQCNSCYCNYKMTEDEDEFDMFTIKLISY